MADKCPTPTDHKYVVSMETVCPATISKCTWTVKDFTKYPSEEIKSPLFEPNATDACEFILQNIANTDADVCPLFCVKYYSEFPVYTTFKVFFYDSNGEGLYKMEKTKTFCPPKKHDFLMKDFPQKKALEMEKDTLIIECEMKISRPESILHTSEGQVSRPPLTTSEVQISQSPLKTTAKVQISPPLATPSEYQESQLPIATPSEYQESKLPIATPSEDQESKLQLATPLEPQRSPSPLAKTSDQESLSPTPSKDSGIGLY